MSKISWWLIGTAIFVFSVYAVMAVLNPTSSSISSPAGSPDDTFFHTVTSYADNLYHLIWPSRGIAATRASPIVQASHALGLAMYCYANDNDGKYPTGKSSTEIFQKLIDGEYITDPAIFYIAELHIPGKRPTTFKKLKPSNVCWDVTVPVEVGRTDGCVPLVFTTGFKINYVAGGSAVPYPTPSSATRGGFTVFYVNNTAAYIRNDGKLDEVVPNVIHFTFKTNGLTYVQLSPDGPVP
jgi:hypothetical protein